MKLLILQQLQQMVQLKICKFFLIAFNLRNKFLINSFFLIRYVIKAVVYEIGILTEVNDDDNSTDYENNV